MRLPTFYGRRNRSDDGDNIVPCHGHRSSPSRLLRNWNLYSWPLPHCGQRARGAIRRDRRNMSVRILVGTGERWRRFVLQLRRSVWNRVRHQESVLSRLLTLTIPYQVMGPPLGGVLYDKLGYRAPFIFSLCLIVVDLALRLCVIEKHVALKWIAVGHEIPNFESPCHLAPTVGDDATVVERAATPRKQKGATWAGVKKLLTDMRPVTACIFIFIEGLAFGGLVESGLTLRLDDHYGLSALQAGLVFIGLVVPTIIVRTAQARHPNACRRSLTLIGPQTSPIAGWAADKWNAKWVVVAGAILTLPVYPLLTVNGPLALFVFFLALLGISLAMFIAPVVHDLGVYTSTVPGLNVLYSYSAFNFWYRSVFNLIRSFFLTEVPLLTILFCLGPTMSVSEHSSVLSSSVRRCKVWALIVAGSSCASSCLASPSCACHSRSYILATGCTSTFGHFHSHHRSKASHQRRKLHNRHRSECL